MIVVRVMFFCGGRLLLKSFVELLVEEPQPLYKCVLSKGV